MKKTNRKQILGALLSAGILVSATAAAEVTYKVDGDKVDKTTWVGSKIYERTFGRGCGTCHDVESNPNLLESVKTLSHEEFVNVVKNGRNAMPKAGAAIMAVKPVTKAGMSEDQAIDAIYGYLVGRSKGDIPPGKLKKIK